MVVLIADKISDTGLRMLEKTGHRWVYVPEATDEHLRTVLASERPRALIVRSTPVGAELMDANPRLELIVRAGAGYDTIDVEAASARGIFVCNCPGKNAAAVAELTIGLLLALDRRIPDNARDAREGRWNKASFGKAAGLRGRVLGVIGMGNVGRSVASLGRSLGMSVMAWSRSLTPERATELGVVYRESLLQIAEGSDAVTLHVAAAPGTEALINRRFFEHMKDGAYFINTSRSTVVDESALRWALDVKEIRAALDVMEGEPAGKTGVFEHALAGHPGVYFTHHIGASTLQAQDATASEAARIVIQYGENNRTNHCVNLMTHSPATHLLTVRHLDRVGVLAAVLDLVRKANWNVQEMENLVFAGAKAACAYIRFDGVWNPGIVRRIEDHPDVLAASVTPIKVSYP